MSRSPFACRMMLARTWSITSAVHFRMWGASLSSLRLTVLAPVPCGTAAALLFFLGQLARGLGRCTLYEYDFVTNELGKYDPSLVLPPDSRRC
jgi:hypothetical protein